ncbi:MAG TPA: hypothetical protein VJ505_02900 [Holophagaceae bacterium]|nr:hypothetical protein [Holophagaceae bacterium]
MDQTKISQGTKRRIEALFPKSQQEEVITILSTQCGNNLPGLKSYTPVELERFQFAALKLSNGELGKLKQAVDLAKIDWRDLLMSAGFGEHINAHNSWLA